MRLWEDGQALVRPTAATVTTRDKEPHNANAAKRKRKKR